MTERPVKIDYEPTDVDARSVFRFTIGLVLATLLVSVALLGLFRGLALKETKRDPPRHPMARSEPDRRPPDPRLQAQPFQDISELRAEEKTLLESYGWVDEEKGIVRIPIDVAMSILARRGLPARGTPAPGPVDVKKGQP